MIGTGSKSHPLIDYGFMIFLVGVAFALTLLFPGLFRTVPFLLFFIAVTLTSWYGGFGPGILASLLSLLLVKRFFLPSSDFPFLSVLDLTRLAALLVVTGAFGILHRQHLRTLDALRRSRDQLDLYLRDMANGITVQDRSARLIYANYEAARTMGFVSGEALISASPAEILTRFTIFDEYGEPFPVTSLPGRLALLGMRYPETVLRYRFKDTGKDHWAYVKARPVFDDKGEVQSSISLFLDITELKEAQRALTDQREQFRVTLRSIGDAVIATDSQGSVTFVNPVASALTGWTEDEALHQPITELVHLIQQQTGEAVENPVARVLDEGIPVRLADHLALVSKTGTEYAIEVMAAPIRDARDQPLGMVMVFRDITERRTAEESLRARIHQQEVVATLGLSALAGNDLTTWIQEAAEQLVQTLHVEYAKVLELLPGGEEMLLRAGVGWEAGLVGKAIVDTGKKSQAGFTLLSDEPVIVEDLRTESRFDGPPLLRRHNVVSGMSVLIAGDHRPWGVLGVHTTQKRGFTKDDIYFVQAIANLIASSINRERTERAEREQRIYAEALRDTAEALGSTLELEQVLDRILENVERVVPHDAADIMLIEGGNARVMRYRGYEEFNLSETILDLQLPLDKTATLREMASTRQPLIVPDTGTYAGWEKLPGMEWLQSYMAVPLLLEGEVKGFLNVSSTTPSFFTPEQASRLQSFAAQATVAIRNAQLYSEARKRANDSDAT